MKGTRRIRGARPVVSQQRIHRVKRTGMRIFVPVCGGTVQLAALRKRQQTVGDLLRDDVLELVIDAAGRLMRVHEVERNKVF